MKKELNIEKVVQLVLLFVLISFSGYAMFTGNDTMVDKILLAVFAGLNLVANLKK